MLPNRERNRGAERATIVMQARTLDLEVLSVKPETACRIEMKLANAERNYFIIDSSVAIDADDGNCSIQCRVIDVPTNRISYREVLVETQVFAGFDCANRGFTHLHNSSVWID